MCGRSCLTLTPEEIQQNCAYCLKKGGKKQPEWRNEYNFGKQYKPSYNIAPTDVTPVLISKSHVINSKEDSSERILVPMMWGIVPEWHKGDYKRHRFHTNNARIEGLTDNRVFKNPFYKNQRCVVLCEGFYEWQTTNSDKTPYLVYAPQSNDKICIEDRKTWENPSEINLLKMAGIFDVWTDEKGDKIWAYTVLTQESNEVLSWMHHRVPIFFETDEEIRDWLDFERVGPEEALKLLKPTKSLKWHEVSKLVNNSRNKQEDCNKKFAEIKKETKEKADKMKITNFFQLTATSSKDSIDTIPPLKKPKLE